MVRDSNAIESSSEKRSSIDRRKIHQGHFCRGQNTGVLSGTLQIPLGETGKTFATMINTILVNTTYRTLNTKHRKRTRKKKLCMHVYLFSKWNCRGRQVSTKWETAATTTRWKYDTGIRPIAPAIYPSTEMF